MGENKQEILERVLLLMNYDNKRTLSENYDRVIYEQPNPNTGIPNFIAKPSFLPQDSGGSPPPLGSKIETIAKWIDDNSVLKPKEWQSYLDSYIGVLSRMSLNELLKLQKEMSKRTGAITKGLPGFITGDVLSSQGSNPVKRFGYTITSIILENEIYNKKVLMGEKPSKPNITLVTDRKMSPYLNKSASQLYNERTKPKENTNTQVNKFRQWFISNFPAKSQNVCGDGEPLDAKGVDNKYYKCAQDYKPWSGKFAFMRDNMKKQSEFNQSLVKQQQNPNIPKPQMYDDITAFAFYVKFLGKDHPLKGKIDVLPEKEKTLEQLKSENWEKQFPEVKILDEKDWEWIESQIKTPFGIESGYPPIIKQAIENKKLEMQNAFYETIAENEFVNNVYSQDEVKCLIGLKKGKICRDLKRGYCGKAGKDYLESVARGERKNCKGQIVGRFYGTKGGSMEIARECGDFEIPCTTEFWENYGTEIQIGGAVVAFLVGLVNPFAGVAIDTLVNGYALSQSIKEKDNVGIAFNTLFLLLPPVFELGALEGAVAKGVFKSTTVESVSNKFRAFMNSNPRATETQIRNFISSLSAEEQEIFRYMAKNGSSDPILRNGLENAVDDMFEGATKKVNKLVNVITLTTYGAAGISYYFTNKILAKKLEEMRKNGQISLQAVKAWDMMDEQMTESERKEITSALSDPEFIKKSMELPEFQKLTQKIASSEGLTPEVLDKKIPELQKTTNDALRATLERLRKEKEELKNNQSNNLNPAQSKRVQNLINQNFIKITFDEYNKEPEKYIYATVDDLWYGRKVK